MAWATSLRPSHVHCRPARSLTLGKAGSTALESACGDDDDNGGLGDGGGGGLGGSSGGEAANPVMGRAADTMVGRAAAADPVMGRVAAVDPGTGDSRWRIRRASSGRGDDIDGRWQRHTAIVALLRPPPPAIIEMELLRSLGRRRASPSAVLHPPSCEPALTALPLPRRRLACELYRLARPHDCPVVDGGCKWRPPHLYLIPS